MRIECLLIGTLEYSIKGYGLGRGRGTKLKYCNFYVLL